MKDYYVALLHYPVYNKQGDIVTTAVANMDIHDIARAAKTFGVRRFYIITPIDAQRAFIRKILDHWLTGYGATFNPTRKEALEIVELAPSLDDCLAEMKALSGKPPRIVVTGAALTGQVIETATLKHRMEEDEAPYLFLFGTGWGLAGEIVARGDYRLAPLRGMTDYNHLSVRSAVAIVLDRLLGNKD
jgi:hypothetical protein